MSFADYAGLSANIRDWLDRLESETDLVPKIPDFVALCESELKADLDERVLMKRTAPALFAANTLPSDYGSPIIVKLYNTDDEEQGELLYATENEITRNRSAYGDGGNPTHYTITGKQIEFFPSSDSTDHKWGMTYYSHPTLDSAVPTSTNDILLDYPGLYLYGSLLHTAPYLEEDTRIVVWQANYDRILAKANEHREDSESGTAQIGMPEGASW